MNAYFDSLVHEKAKRLLEKRLSTLRTEYEALLKWLSIHTGESMTSPKACNWLERLWAIGKCHTIELPQDLVEILARKIAKEIFEKVAAE